jgi:hypothetical protein
MVDAAGVVTDPGHLDKKSGLAADQLVIAEYRQDESQVEAQVKAHESGDDATGTQPSILQDENALQCLP